MEKINRTGQTKKPANKSKLSHSPKTQAILGSHIKLTKAYETLSNYLGKKLKEQGTTGSQFAVLETILNLGPLTQRQLADKVLRSKANLTGVIDNLEQNDLVIRCKDPNDRRNYLIELTPLGRTLVKKVFAQHIQNLNEVYGVLTSDEIKTLGIISKKLGLHIKALP